MFMINKDKKYLNDKLRSAIKKQDKTAIIRWVKNGADINYIDKDNDHNILMEFSKTVNPEIIELLISLGGDPCYTNRNTINLFQNLAFFIHTMLLDNDHLDYSNVFPYLGKTIAWIKTYDAQKLCIEKFPDSLHEMYKCKMLNPIIINEYQYMISAFELNLL